MQKGLVSVMMPAYNAAEFIAEAIDSVLAQMYPHWELLVVNDGSTDATAEIVARYSDPRIKLIHKENGGEASARNVALDHSTGEFIAYLDADDAYLPHHLSVLVEYLQSHPDRDAVYTDGFHFDRAGNRLQPLSDRRRGPFEGRIFEEVVRASDVFGPPLCVMLRHRLVAEHRLRYDTRIVIGPDWDFFVRFSDLGTFGYVDDRTCLYRVHETNISVQVGMQRRAGYLAICRENAIKLPNFGTLSAETRAAVFYDLLITLLAGQPEKQSAVTQWAEFRALPAAEQARLLRLLASQSLLAENGQPELTRRWLADSRRLNPADRRGAVLAALYGIHPAVSRAFLRFKSLFNPREINNAPLGDIKTKN